jgi:ABC-type branched-subunit amino acid transport system ATPase component
MAALQSLERVGLDARATEAALGLGPVERARLTLACALSRTPAFLVVREIDDGFGPSDADTVRGILRALAHRDRLAIVAGAATPAAARGFADRLVVIAEGLLRYNGRPAEFSDDRVA